MQSNVMEHQSSMAIEKTKIIGTPEVLNFSDPVQLDRQLNRVIEMKLISDCQSYQEHLNTKSVPLTHPKKAQ